MVLKKTSFNVVTFKRKNTGKRRIKNIDNHCEIKPLEMKSLPKVNVINKIT